MAVAIKKAKLEEGVKSSITINGEVIVQELVNIGISPQISEELQAEVDEIAKEIGLEEPEARFDMGGYQFRDWENIKSKIAQLKVEMEEKELWLAKHHCPYVPGMKLKTNRGLGLIGLVVQEIVAPKFFGGSNRWEVVCYAIAKNGEVTRRTVSFDERMAKYDLAITIVQEGA
jgi:hypothetical protein